MQKNNAVASFFIKSQNTRPTIAYLTNMINDDTGQAIWSGVVDAAQAHDVNLLCFPGRCLSDPRDFQAQGNILYDLARSGNVDGITSWASSIGTYVSATENRTLHERYRPLPIVPIGGAVQGFPSLLIDGYQGMRTAIAHLIEHHGYRRIAFIRGPEGHSQAQERYRAYIETLKAHNLPSDPQLITPPHHWDRKTGVEAMRLLLDERKLRPHTDFEAVVGASDVLLLGALEEMKNRGIRIPQDVAALGFNNSPLGRAHTPPLTSVAAPFHEMGSQSVAALANLIHGKQASTEMLIPQLVIRQSCGCVDPAIEQAAVAEQEMVQGATFESLSNPQREHILAILTQAVGDAGACIAPGWEKQLVDGFIIELKGSAGSFLQKLNEVLRQVMTANGDVAAWHGAVSVLRREVYPYLHGDTQRRSENLWQQARVLISGVVEQMQVYQSIQAAQRIQTLRDIEMELLTSFDVTGLMQVLAKNLPRLGITRCYLSLYEDPQPYTYPQPAPEWSRLILAYTEKGRIELEPGGQRFHSCELVPADMLPRDRQSSFVVEPLYFQDQQLGFALFEIGPRDGQTYEILRAQISSALKGALLLQERRQAEAAMVKERDALKSLVAQIQETATRVTSASTGILTFSTQLAATTEEQASSVNEITATVQEIKSSAEQVAQHAQGVAESAGQAVQVAQKGTEAVQAAIVGMSEIQQKVEVIAENILALSNQTLQIGNIIDTVTDIAAQSNILALNAAIEAAHAGELGARFRVVADEVKKLAGQSRQSATQVKLILRDIQKAANQTVNATEQGTRQVDAGSALVTKAAETINELAKVVAVSEQSAQQIVAGVQQQTIGLDQIGLGMNDINQAAQQTATGAQQSQKAAEDLNELAERLKLLANQHRS